MQPRMKLKPKWEPNLSSLSSLPDLAVWSLVSLQWISVRFKITEQNESQIKPKWNQMQLKPQWKPNSNLNKVRNESKGKWKENEAHKINIKPRWNWTRMKSELQPSLASFPELEITVRFLRALPLTPNFGGFQNNMLNYGAWSFDWSSLSATTFFSTDDLPTGKGKMWILRGLSHINAGGYGANLKFVEKISYLGSFRIAMWRQVVNKGVGSRSSVTNVLVDYTKSLHYADENSRTP